MHMHMHMHMHMLLGAVCPCVHLAVHRPHARGALRRNGGGALGAVEQRHLSEAAAWPNCADVVRRAVVLGHLDDEFTVLDDVAPGKQRDAQGLSLQPTPHGVAASAKWWFNLRCKIAAPFALVIALPYELLPVLACDALPCGRERRVALLVDHRVQAGNVDRSIAARAEEQIEERRLV